MYYKEAYLSEQCHNYIYLCICTCMDFACTDKYEKFPDRKSMLEYAGIPASPDKV